MHPKKRTRRRPRARLPTSRLWKWASLATLASLLEQRLQLALFSNTEILVRRLLLVLVKLRLLFVGPISDQLVRRAYVAGYDRRMRHPAWVSPSSRISFQFVLFTSFFCFTLDGRTFDVGFSWEISCRRFHREGK